MTSDAAVEQTAVESFASSYEASSATDTAPTDTTPTNTTTSADDSADTSTPSEDQNLSDTNSEGASEESDDTTPEDTSGESPEADEADKEGDEGKEGETKEAQSYEEFTFPENTQIDTATLEEAKDLMAELNLNQEQAQKCVSWYASKMSQMTAQATEQHTKQVEAWKNETIETFGKDGDAVFDQHKATAQSAVNKFFSPEQRRHLVAMGIGNMSGFFAMAKTIGEAMKEDGSFAAGAGNSNTEETVADIWYPSKS